MDDDPGDCCDNKQCLSDKSIPIHVKDRLGRFVCILWLKPKRLKFNSKTSAYDTGYGYSRVIASIRHG